MSQYRQVITEVVALVEEMCEPLTLRELALALGVPASEIRKQVRLYDPETTADQFELVDLRPEVFIEPAEGDDDGADSDEDRVNITGRPSRDLLGIERFDAAVLAPLYQAAAQLSDVEPGNEALATATEGLLAQFLPGLRPRSRFRSDLVGRLGRAISSGNKVELRYSRAWEPGIFTRVVDPYRIVTTRRGPELDAGPPDADGNIRTYLVGRMQDVRILPRTFERPTDAVQRCQAARATTTVTGETPATRLWVVERAAEATRVVSRDGELVRFEADLLPPVAWRAGRMAVTAGAGTRLDDPAAQAAAVRLAEELWSHHDLDEPAA